MRKIIVTRDPAKINLAVLKLVEQLGDLTALSTLASDADYARNQAVAAAAASQENRAAAEVAKSAAASSADTAATQAVLAGTRAANAAASEAAGLGHKNGAQEVFDAALRGLNWTPNRVISARAVFDAKMLTAQAGSLPENSTPVAESLFAVDPTYGPYVRRDLTTTNPFSTYTRPVFTMKPDSVFRIRVKARFAQPTVANWRMVFLTADGTAQVRSISMTGIVAGEVRDYEAIIGKTAGGIVTHVHATAADWDRPYFRGGIASAELIAGGTYDLFVLDIEDLTLLDLATRAAQAANAALGLSVRFDVAQTLTLPQKLQAAANIEAVSFGQAQTLTAPQKTQARENIGAAQRSDNVRYDTAQGLNAAQMGVARANIGLGDFATLNTNGDASLVFMGNGYQTFRSIAAIYLRHNELGSLTWATTSLGQFGPGGAISGGNLRPSGCQSDGNGAGIIMALGGSGLYSGTWQCLGFCAGIPGQKEGASLWIKVGN